MKECKKCWIKKSLDCFGKSVKWKLWLKSRCKDCLNEETVDYQRTRNWLCSVIYSAQRACSKRRWHYLPKYTLEELRSWLFSQENFEFLYKSWVDWWYKKQSKPSCDRINDYKWYSFDNMELKTWWENLKKSYRDKKNWINNKQSKTVLQLTLSWEIIREYYSMWLAERVTWVPSSKISYVCNWKYKTAWWYVWEYA